MVRMDSPPLPFFSSRSRETESPRCPREDRSKGRETWRRQGWIDEASHMPYVPAFFRHSLARRRLRHPNRTRTAGASRRENNDDLHPCSESRGAGCQKPGGQPVSTNRVRIMRKPYKTRKHRNRNPKPLNTIGLGAIARGVSSGSNTRKRVYRETI